MVGLVLLALAVVLLALASGLLVRGRLQRGGPPGPAPAPPADATPYRQPHDGARLLPLPLRVDDGWFRKHRRQAYLGGAAAVGALLLLLLYSGSVARDAVRSAAVWSSGVRPTKADVDGSWGQHLIFVNRSSVQVTYTDATGAEHRGEAMRLGLGGPLNLDRAVLKYDPADPDSFAVSLFEQNRIDELLLHLLLLGLAFPVVFLTLRETYRRHRELARIHATLSDRPEEVVLRVLSILGADSQPGTTVHYSMRIPDGELLHVAIPAEERPLFLELDTWSLAPLPEFPAIHQSHVLGLRRPGDRAYAVVLRSDLAPLVPDLPEARRVRQRWRGETGA